MVEAQGATVKAAVAEAPPVDEEAKLAFPGFFGDQYKKVVQMIVFAGGELREAEDAAMIAFADVFNKWSTIRSPKAYVRKAARNAFIKKREKDRRLMSKLEETAEGQAAEAVQDGSLRQVDDYCWVESVIADLPEKQRRVMRSIVDGLSHTQIAELLGTNEANVRSNLRHARTRLEQHPDLAAMVATRSTGTTAPRKGETS